MFSWIKLTHSKITLLSAYSALFRFWILFYKLPNLTIYMFKISLFYMCKILNLNNNTLGIRQISHNFTRKNTIMFLGDLELIIGNAH